MRWRVRKRRRLLMLAAVLVLAMVVVYILRPRPDLRSGSAEIAASHIRVATRAPRSYRIVYRVENRAAGTTTVSTDKLWVDRPFRSRLEVWSGPPPGRRRLSSTVNVLGRLDTGRAVFAIPPGPAPDDRRPDAFLREAVRAGYASAREWRRVAGRTCRSYRIGGDPGIDSLVPVRSIHDNYSEVCVDAAGLVLEQVGFFEGELSSRRLAVTIDEHPQLSDALFRTGNAELPVDKGGGSVRRVDPHSRPPGTFWEAPSGPEGFGLEGRYTVVPPQTGFTDPTARARIVAWVSDVWVRGSDAVVIEQGATLEGAEPFSDDPNARRVSLGALGRGELTYSLRASEVRVKMRGGHFVRLIGTVAPSRLLAMARSLREGQGGTLVFLDKGPS